MKRSAPGHPWQVWCRLTQLEREKVLHVLRRSHAACEAQEAEVRHFDLGSLADRVRATRRALRVAVAVLLADRTFEEEP